MTNTTSKNKLFVTLNTNDVVSIVAGLPAEFQSTALSVLTRSEGVKTPEFWIRLDPNVNSRNH